MVYPSSTMSLDALRARISQIEGAPLHQNRCPSGVEVLDQLLGGLPTPGIVEVSGTPGSGRSRLAFAVAAAVTDRQQPVAWVDPSMNFFPPAASHWGVSLEYLLLVHPTADRESWAIEQVCRSGCFSVVIALEPKVPSRLSRKWVHCTEAGQCTLLVLNRRPSKSLSPSVRLQTNGREVLVSMDRHGIPGKHRELPSWPEGSLPWV